MTTALALTAERMTMLLWNERLSRPVGRECTTDAAQRIAKTVADIVCRDFPDIDRVLLVAQLESDYMEWALRNNCFIASPKMRL